MRVFRGSIKYACLWLFVFGPMFKVAPGDGVNVMGLMMFLGALCTSHGHHGEVTLTAPSGLYSRWLQVSVQAKREAAGVSGPGGHRGCGGLPWRGEWTPDGGSSIPPRGPGISAALQRPDCCWQRMDGR